MWLVRVRALLGMHVHALPLGVRARALLLGVHAEETALSLSCNDVDASVCLG
jgi:hypothetical protein